MHQLLSLAVRCKLAVQLLWLSGLQSFLSAGSPSQTRALYAESCASLSSR